jgi:hypothetical protein
MGERICSAPDCERPAEALGWCGMHRERIRRRGVLTLAYRPTLEERFWAKVNKTETCWLWTGASSQLGYGRLWVNGKWPQAHRLAYEWLVGPIPPGLVLDHLCRRPACVNPTHLEPVTQRENVARGVGPQVVSAMRQAQTHCKRGHEFTEANTYMYRGSRCCRTCNKLKCRRQYYERQARRRAEETVFVG